MTDPILVLLTRLRNLYAMHLAAISMLPRSDAFHPSEQIQDCQEAIGELDRQIVLRAERQ